MNCFVSHLLHISHYQWIFHNFTLNDHTWGYLHLKERKDVLKTIEQLVETDPDEILEERKVSMEMDSNSLHWYSFKKESYCVRVVKAEQRAVRHTVFFCGHITVIPLVDKMILVVQLDQ